MCLYLNRTYERLPEPDSRGFAYACGASLLSGMVLFIAASALFPDVRAVAPEALVVGLLSVLSLAATRQLLPCIIRYRWLSEGQLILGANDAARKLREELSAAGPFAKRPTTGKPAEATVSLGYGNLRDWVLRHGFSRIVLADPPTGGSAELASAMVECRAGGVRVEQAVDSYGRLCGKLWLPGLHPEWLIHTTAFRVSPHFLVYKRIADVAGAAILLLASLPFLILAAVAIKLDSEGPIFIWQERVGLNGKRFLMAKLRSMRVDAERASGPTWCRAGDSRITRVGRVLRKFRLDEIPQVVNVLKGEMSFIGPRPERPAFVEVLSARIPYYPLRHLVKPGISGWAQVMYPYGASLEDAREKLQYDLYYLRSLSIAFDARILLRTFKVVIAGGGR